MLNVIYEDNHLLVVEKPVNILSQGDNTNDDDMVNLLKKYLKEKYNKPGNVFVSAYAQSSFPRAAGSVSTLRVIYMEIMMMTAIISEMALPKFQSPLVRNWVSMTLPMSTY